ncbi:hypothetical protein G7Y89_g15746 [Cudoniella acicularis]|uniref:Transmembrane protein n=1 Tax=Cudoniella acicularis TaxID=354080 RepID=A0A8H4QG62_9HELO|nr:hypothetical protein G7Y89_g15746 [Cudoniella acicularis]
MAAAPVPSLSSSSTTVTTSTHYGATSTTTFFSTITALPGEKSLPIGYPWPAVTASPAFTTESVLVLTAVVGVVVGTDGKPLVTGTLVQTALPQQTAESSGGATLRCPARKCWTTGQQIGTVFGIVFAAIVIVAVIVGALCFKRTSRIMRDVREKPERDIEGGRRKERRRIATLLLGAKPQSLSPEIQHRRQRRRHRSRSGTTSSSSSSSESSSERSRRTNHPSMRTSAARAPSRFPNPTRRDRDRSAQTPAAPYPEVVRMPDARSSGRTASRTTAANSSRVRGYAVPAAAATISRSNLPPTRDISTRRPRRSRGPPPASMREPGDRRDDSRRRHHKRSTDDEIGRRTGRNRRMDRDSSEDNGYLRHRR